MGKTGIIIEGGAMRSIYAAGILDYFLEQKIEIPNVLAVSAGAYAGMNYVSGQKGRVLEAVIKPLKEYKYLGIGTFLKRVPSLIWNIYSMRFRRKRFRLTSKRF